IARAHTKCRRSNLPSRRPLQHGQEASRRTICSFVIVSLFGDLTQFALCASASFTLILHVRSRQKCVALLRRALKRRYVDLVITLCGLISERRFPYWLAETMRAIKTPLCPRRARVDAAQPIEFAVRRLISFPITAPAAVLSTTRPPRRMDIEAGTECQMGILSGYGNCSL